MQHAPILMFNLKHIRPIVFWIPLVLFAVLVATSIWDARTFFDNAKTLNDWVLKVFSNWFALVVGFAAFIMTSGSGVDGIKMLSNLGGLPALFIILSFNVVLIVLGTFKLKALRDA